MTRWWCSAATSSAVDDHIHPYLPELARLMRAFADADKAVLGICLGSQILARAHGAENLLGRTREFGWHQVELTSEGLSDPVLGAAGKTFTSFEWHSDSFALPEGAVHLATNPAVANQAFRIGRAAYGMQFHFEAGTPVVEGWNRVFEDQIMDLDPHWLERYPEHAARHAEAGRCGRPCIGPGVGRDDPERQRVWQWGADTGGDVPIAKRPV